VGPRVGLDAVEKILIYFLPLARNKNPILQQSGPEASNYNNGACNWKIILIKCKRNPTLNKRAALYST
jgi:hypothetical protein